MSDRVFKYGNMAVTCPGCERMFYAPTVTATEAESDADARIQCRRCVQNALSVEVDE